jgi:glycosyltransferase involved in cell wall biosynthesis
MNMSQYPLVSLCIFTYKQEQYIRETIEGALSQDYPNLEIIISDDNSPDSTFEIICSSTKAYGGPHKLIINKNTTNLGIVRHSNKLIYELSHGDIIMLSGGDDVCMPHLITNSIEQLLKSGCSSMAFNAYIIDCASKRIGVRYKGLDNKNEIYALEDYLSDQYKTNGACRIIKREIFDTFGPLNDDCQTEDTPNLFRSFLYGKVGFCYTPNLNYRVHGNNISGFHNLMTKFDPKKIAKQYQRDLNTAADRGIINNSTKKRLQHNIDYYLYRQTAIRKLYRHKYLSRFVLLFWYCVDWRLNLSTKKSFIQSALSWTSADIKASIGSKNL